MYCLLNDAEASEVLVEKILRKLLCKAEPKWPRLRELYLRHQKGLLSKQKIKDLLNLYIEQDLTDHLTLIKKRYKKWRRPLSNHIANSFSRLTQQAENRNHILTLYLKSSQLGFVKNFGPQVSEKITWITRNDSIDPNKPILLRNIQNNHELTKFKLENNLPFWFIDTGYTNFLYPKGKPWHRVVKNHIHHKPINRYFPADRLNSLPCFPLPWRKHGKVILVIESSNEYLRLFNTSLSEWKNNVTEQIKLYSNYPIEFRRKEINKKIRSSVYQDLKERDDIYCVITHSSTAAVESIWLGVPVITLDRHITNGVSRSSIKDVNNLYRGPVGDWLCALTYSQFTFEEICDGTARKILRTYHNV